MDRTCTTNPTKIWREVKEAFGAEPYWEKQKRLWDAEVEAAEKRLKAREENEARIAALQKAREPQEEHEEFPKHDSFLTPNEAAPAPQAAPQAAPATSPRPLSEQDPTTIGDTRLYLPHHTPTATAYALTGLGRFPRSVSPRTIQNLLETDIRRNGNYFAALGVPHPLQARWDVHFAETLGPMRGHAHLGHYGAMVREALRERWGWGVDEGGVLMQRGWPRGRGEWEAVEEGVREMVGWEVLRGVRLGLEEEEAEVGEAGSRQGEEWEAATLLGEGQSVGEVGSVIVEEIELPVPHHRRARSITLDDRFGAAWEEEDPAEAIAAYYEERGRWFDLDSGVELRRMRSMGL